MHVIPAPTNSAVTLYARTGVVQSFLSPGHALRALGYGWISDNVGEYFRVAGRRCFVPTVGGDFVGWRTSDRTYDYILRDATGLPLTAGDFTQLALSGHASRRARLAFWNGEGPVPGTSKQRGGPWRHSRRVRTTQERRFSLVLDEAEEPPRAARRGKNLPDNRDDVALSRQPHRNWKKYRSHQWKECSMKYA